MSKEQNEKQAIEEMRKDLVEIFDEEYEKRRIITADFTAIKMTGKGYRKQSEGEWKDNHCTNCGMTPIGEETWTAHGKTPPKFELCMDYCPNCGAKMKGGE